MKILFLLVLTLGKCIVYGQGTAVIEVGRPCPPFELKELNYFVEKRATLSSFRGRYLILDFWTTGCAGCIESWRKINELQSRYRDRLQFVLVGQDHFGISAATAKAKEGFEKYRQRWSLQLPVAYDADLFQKFKVPFVPYCIWIDPAGIVKAITSSMDVNEDNIKAFTAGEEIKIRYPVESTPEIAYKDFDYNKVLLINGNGGEDSVFLFRSILSRWNPGTSAYKQIFITSNPDNGRGRSYWAGVEKNRVQVNGVPLLSLIELAYGDTVNHGPGEYVAWDSASEKYFAQTSYGKFWRKPVLEVRDSSDFSFEASSGKNLYSYSLIVPMEKASGALLKQAMQRDLMTYFPYDILVESRRMPCWFLTSHDRKSKLMTKGGDILMQRSPSGLELRNVPVRELILNIAGYSGSQPPIIDQTGISGHIDIVLKAAMMDFQDVRLQLEKHGLYLQKGKKDMKVIVVRERMK